MTEDVKRFFEIYDADASLRARLANDVAMYPGSLEIREALVGDVLMPVAEELGFHFTMHELRAYETKKKLERSQSEQGYDDSFEGYWLLERGWSSDESKFCSGSESSG